MKTFDRLLSFHETAVFDPVTLTAIGAIAGGLGGLGTAAASIFGPKPKAPTMPAPSPPASEPQSQSLSTPAGQPSFLAAAAAPSAGSQKSLLGQ
jgi:hypothetical protein